ETALARDEQHAPVPHDAGDRRAGLAVGAVGWQLVRLANRLAVMAGADAAGQVDLPGGEVLPLMEHRSEERLVSGLGVDVGDAGIEVEGTHRMADDRSGITNGLDVLVVVE